MKIEIKQYSCGKCQMPLGAAPPGRCPYCGVLFVGERKRPFRFPWLGGTITAIFGTIFLFFGWNGVGIGVLLLLVVGGYFGRERWLIVAATVTILFGAAALGTTFKGLTQSRIAPPKISAHALRDAAPGEARSITYYDRVFTIGEELFDETDVEVAEVALDYRGHEVLRLRLRKTAAEAIAAYTEANVGTHVGFFVEGKLASAPLVNSRATGPIDILVPSMDRADADRLASGFAQPLPTVALLGYLSLASGLTLSLVAYCRLRWRRQPGPTQPKN